MADAAEIGSVRVAVEGAIGTIVLNDPDRLNPIGVDMAESLIAAVHWIEAQRDVKVVVVRGEGRAFSAGADVTTFGRDLGPDEARAAADTGRRMADVFEATPPVCIAQIHGHCVGGAVVLAAACDLRIAADDVRFAIPELDLGIPLVWGGIPRLIREIGPARTKDLVMTGRPFSAREALEAGFLTSVVPHDDLQSAVDELVTTLVAKPRYALLSTKRHVNAVADLMVQQSASWADADRFLAATADDEGRAAAAAYLDSLRRRAES